MKHVPPLSPHGKKILALLGKSATPLTAYDILDRLRSSGIKAPPTVYRALEALMKQGLVHRIESLNAFVACHHHDEDHAAAARFAVCRSCGKVAEILDSRFSKLIHDIGKRMKFHVERDMLEVLGLCKNCDKKAA